MTMQKTRREPSASATENSQRLESASGVEKKLADSMWSIYDQSESLPQFMNSVVGAFAEYFNSPYVSLIIETNQGQGRYFKGTNESAELFWERKCSGPLLDAKYRNQARASVIDTPKSPIKFAVLAAPVSLNSASADGSIAVVVKYDNREKMAAQLQALQSAIAVTSTLASNLEKRPKTAATRTGSETNAATQASGYQSLMEFAFAIVNNLKAKLGCESASLGMVRRNRVKLLCVSGTSHIDERSLGTLQIEQAMNECLDAGEICHFQTGGLGRDAVPVNYMLHRTWHLASGGAAVASIPLLIDGKCVAILSIRHLPGEAFTKEQLEKISELATPLMPGAMLLDKAQRQLVEQVLQTTRDWLKAKFRTDTIVRRLAIGAVIGLVLFIAFGKQTYRITVPSTIVPAGERAICSPYDGTISEVHIRPGEFVEKGQLLACLDSKALQLELQQATSDLAAANMEAVQASAVGDPGKSAIAHAKATAIKANIQKLERKIALSQIRAPNSGVILSGDIDKRIGESVPVGEPLLEFAPIVSWKVELEVPEFANSFLQLGQVGRFYSNARPDMPLDFHLENIHASAQVREGQNIILSKGHINSENPTWLRSGMQGTARLAVGKYPIWWVWVHRVIDQVRIKLWRM